MSILCLIKIPKKNKNGVFIRLSGTMITLRKSSNQRFQSNTNILDDMNQEKDNFLRITLDLPMYFFSSFSFLRKILFIGFYVHDWLYILRLISE